MYTTAKIHPGKKIHIIKVTGQNANVLCQDDKQKFFAPGAQPLPINGKSVDCKKCLELYRELPPGELKK